jgi:hypothetical protein
MSKRKIRPQQSTGPSPFDQARDELFQHIMTCGVTGADPQHQTEWFTETMAYFADRFPELTPKQLSELQTLGERFAQPPRARTEAREDGVGAASAA